MKWLLTFPSILFFVFWQDWTEMFTSSTRLATAVMRWRHHTHRHSVTSVTGQREMRRRRTSRVSWPTSGTQPFGGFCCLLLRTARYMHGSMSVVRDSGIISIRDYFLKTKVEFLHKLIVQNQEPVFFNHKLSFSPGRWFVWNNFVKRPTLCNLHADIVTGD